MAIDDIYAVDLNIKEMLEVSEIKYGPYDSKKLPRYEGLRSFMRLPVVEEMPRGLDFAIVGIPLDGASTFESGQRMAPVAVRSASVNCRGYHPELDVELFAYLQGADFGDAPMLPGYIEECYANTEKKIDEVYAAGAVPFCIGGDHAVTLPILRAAAKKHGKFALLHFDAHYDNNDQYFGKKYNHATWVYHGVSEGLIDPGHSLQLGMRGPCFVTDRQQSKKLGIETITAEEMRDLGIEETVRRIKDRIGDMKIFCSFDIDFVDPSCAPATGTMEPGGFMSWETFRLIRAAKEMELIGMDMVEVLPAMDRSGITSNLAAYIMYDFIAMMAWRKKQGKCSRG